jgi:hypothetical protein
MLTGDTILDSRSVMLIRWNMLLGEFPGILLIPGCRGGMFPVTGMLKGVVGVTGDAA